MNTELKVIFVVLPLLLFSVIGLTFYGNHIVEDAEINHPEDAPMIRKIVGEFVPIFH